MCSLSFRVQFNFMYESALSSGADGGGTDTQKKAPSVSSSATVPISWDTIAIANESAPQSDPEAAAAATASKLSINNTIV